MSGTTPALGTTAAAPFLLPNDWILDVTIDALSAAGVVDPLPTGDVPTVTVDPATGLAAVIGFAADGITPSVLLNATVDGSVTPAVVYTVVIADSKGLTPVSLFFSIVADNVPASLGALLSVATHTSQPVPTTVG
jgi:hypothetical protein